MVLYLIINNFSNTDKEVSPGVCVYMCAQRLISATMKRFVFTGSLLFDGKWMTGDEESVLLRSGQLLYARGWRNSSRNSNYIEHFFSVSS